MFIRKTIKAITVLLFAVILPALGYCQPVDPGGNPDGNPPLAVPIDARLNLILITIGVIFAIIILRKINSRQHVKKI
jgi:hypothetical protein